MSKTGSPPPGGLPSSAQAPAISSRRTPAPEMLPRLNGLALHFPERGPRQGPALLGRGEFDRRLRRLESPDPVGVSACAQHEATGDVRHPLPEAVEPRRRRDCCRSPLGELRGIHDGGPVRGNVRGGPIERVRFVKRWELDAAGRRWGLEDRVFESEHLGPFLEGTLWRTRGQEITDSGRVYQVEAGDPEGHPWLMSFTVAESTCRRGWLTTPASSPGSTNASPEQVTGPRS